MQKVDVRSHAFAFAHMQLLRLPYSGLTDQDQSPPTNSGGVSALDNFLAILQVKMRAQHPPTLFP